MNAQVCAHTHANIKQVEEVGWTQENPFLWGLPGTVKQRQLELSEEAVGRVEAELAPLRDADIFLGNKISSFQHQT